MYQHILIPTNGSEVAQKGVNYGLALANALGVKLTVVAVSTNLWLAGIEDGRTAQAYVDYIAIRKMTADDVLNKVRRAADQLGVEIDTVCVVNARPANAIVRIAKVSDCDLIVMSSHGRRGFRRLIFGSVSSEVAAHSPVPVLVVR